MRTRIWLLLGLPLLLLPGCKAEPGHLPGAEFDPNVRTRDPALLVSLLVSTTTPEASRKSADGLLVEVKGKTDPTRLGVLEQILYAPGHSDAMRIYALDQLADADPGHAGSALVRYLPRFEGNVLAHACELAVKLGDPRLIDPLMRSLDAAMDGHPNPPENSPWKERPEWSALAQLSGKSLQDALYDTVLHAPAPGTRIAALDLLATRAPPQEVLKRLPPSPSDRWLSDICWWLETFGTFPFGENESNWIAWLHKPEQAALVARAVERHKLLAGQADYHPAPRHMHTLAYAAESSVRMSRAQLIASLEKRLAALPHVHRSPEYPGAPEDVQDTLAAHSLMRADLLAIDLLLTAWQTPATLQELQRLGLADLSDNTTEHGGLLAFINVQRPTLMLTPYAPLYANNDFEYVSSDKLLRETVQGVAQYHLHFQQIRNSQRAGPGAGDLAYARRTRCNCVVITSTDTREMNIDFYTPDGAVVDLGTYTVPAP